MKKICIAILTASLLLLSATSSAEDITITPENVKTIKTIPWSVTHVIKWSIKNQSGRNIVVNVLIDQGTGLFAFCGSYIIDIAPDQKQMLCPLKNNESLIWDATSLTEPVAFAKGTFTIQS